MRRRRSRSGTLSPAAQHGRAGLWPLPELAQRQVQGQPRTWRASREQVEVVKEVGTGVEARGVEARAATARAAR
eukprot:6494071-Prymnesium_polylepis.1